MLRKGSFKTICDSSCEAAARLADYKGVQSPPVLVPVVTTATFVSERSADELPVGLVAVTVLPPVSAATMADVTGGMHDLSVAGSSHKESSKEHMKVSRDLKYSCITRPL